MVVVVKEKMIIHWEKMSITVLGNFRKFEVSIMTDTI